jgi:hypothetical protein
MKKDCRKCKFLSIYYSTDQSQIIRICTGDGWEEVDDGLYSLIEVSEFNPTNCLMFAEK